MSSFNKKKIDRGKIRENIEFVNNHTRLYYNMPSFLLSFD